MRILLGVARVGDVPATRALSALSEGWAETNPTAEIIGVVCSDGALDLLDAVESARGGERRVVPVLGPDGRSVVPALFLLSGGTAFLQAQDILGSLDHAGSAGGPTAPGAGSIADSIAGATSFGVGQLVRAAIGAGARRVVVGCGTTPSLDLGVGFLAGLGGRAPGEPAAPVASGEPGEPVAPGESVVGVPVEGTGLAELVTSARAALGDAELVLAAAGDQTVRGLRGAAQALAPVVGGEAAARLDAQVAPVERALGLLAAQAHRPDLLAPTTSTPRAGGVPGAGVGGGLGAAVLAVGGRVAPGPRFLAGETDLTQRAGDVDVVVSLTDRIDPLEADRGVLGAVSAVGRAQGAAVLALGRTGSLDRRAGAPHGISAAALVPVGVAGIRSAGVRQGRAWSW